MGIFNENIFKELEDGIKNFSKKVKENFNESKNELSKENQIKKCPNCGANIESGDYDCKYCGIEIRKKPKKARKEKLNYTDKISYPVVVEFDSKSEKYEAIDYQTGKCSLRFSSVANVLENIQEVLQEYIDDGYVLKFWTEDQLSKKLAVKNELKKGAKIKFVELNYVDPKKDPNW